MTVLCTLQSWYTLSSLGFPRLSALHLITLFEKGKSLLKFWQNIDKWLGLIEKTTLDIHLIVWLIEDEYNFQPEHFYPLWCPIGFEYLKPTASGRRFFRHLRPWRRSQSVIERQILMNHSAELGPNRPLCISLNFRRIREDSVSACLSVEWRRWCWLTPFRTEFNSEGITFDKNESWWTRPEIPLIRHNLWSTNICLTSIHMCIEILWPRLLVLILNAQNSAFS